MFQLDNKGIVFKVRRFVRPDINTGVGRDHYLSGMPSSFHAKIMIRSVFKYADGFEDDYH